MSIRLKALMLSLGAFASLFLPSVYSQETVCAQVKIEILQELTLEREAFEGRMTINNGLAGVSLDQITVDVTFADRTGTTVRATSDPNDLTAKFFIRLQDGSSIPASIPGGTSTRITWLIIPAKGAAGASSQGELYSVGATLRYRSGGENQEVQVTPDTITVKPLPDLSLDYFLPSEVYADDPFTENVVEPAVPFSLGVRVKNNGYGTARSLRIESAQPKIVENKLGLLVDFRTQGTEVNGQPATASLLANFGDIQPNRSGVARWVMTSTLSGRFVEFTANYTHADELGGELTSLFSTNGIRTHFLVHDVLVDLPGRDGIRDFLALDGTSLKVYESDCTDTSAADLSAGASIFGSNGRYTVSTAPSTGFSFIKLTDPLAGAPELRSATRADGKTLNPANAWLSKTQDRTTHQWSYFVNVFDVNNTAGSSYTLNLAPGTGQTNRPPVLDSIANLTINAGSYISFPISAFDPDGNTLTYTLMAGPTNATLHPGTGLLQWQPTTDQEHSTNLFVVKVTDNGTPSLSDTSQFTVVVNPAIGFVLSVGSTNVIAGESNSVPLTLSAALAIGQVNFTLMVAEAYLNNLKLRDVSPVVLDSALTRVGSNQYHVSFTVDPLRVQSTIRTLAILDFASLAVSNSAIAPLRISQLIGTNAVGAAVTNGMALDGIVVVFVREPVLIANHDWTATLYGRPGASYAIELKSNSINTAWMDYSRIPLADKSKTFAVVSNLSPSFYRAYEFQADPPSLDLLGQEGSTYSFVFYGKPGTRYMVDTAASSTEPVQWLPVRSMLLANSWMYFSVTNSGPEPAFYRIREFQLGPSTLSLQASNGVVINFVLYGQAGVQYVLQTATNVDTKALWLPVTTVSLTNNTQPFGVPKPADPVRFYRTQAQ